MFFRENAGVGNGAGSSNSSGAGVLTILPKSLSSLRAPSFLRNFALVRSRGLAERSSDGVGEAGARSAGSGGAVLGTETARGGAGAGGGGSAGDAHCGGSPTIMSRVGRCRGLGSESERYVRVTTSSAGYITYIPGETASRRPLAPSEEDYALLSTLLLSFTYDCLSYVCLLFGIAKMMACSQGLTTIEVVECFVTSRVALRFGRTAKECLREGF